MFIRLLFYLTEAALLTVPATCGLLLAQRSARRLGRHFFEVTPLRVAMIFGALAAFGAATGEWIGPQCIAQYYAAAVVCGLGVISWLFSRLATRRRATRVKAADS